MKTKKYLALIILLTVIFASGCGKTSMESKKEISKSMFTEIEHKQDKYKVLYHNETKVMYVVSDGGYNKGTFTLLVNKDGSPMIWEE